MSKVKIAHVVHSVGGVDVYLRLVFQSINSELFESIVIHGEADTSNPFIDRDNKQITEYKTSIVRNISFFNDFKAIWFTYHTLKLNRPHIIHAHSAKGGVIGKIVGLLLGIKVLYTPHAFSFLSTRNPIKKIVFIAIERLLANKNSILLPTSNSEKQRGLIEAKYKPENIIVFENCIRPIQKVEPLAIEKKWSDNYICTVGRPSYQKNIELMVEVLHEARKKSDIHLIVMGVGHHADQLQSVKKLIHELNLEPHVTLLDWASQADVFHIISKSRFYISTARYEGLPYSVIESLALSKPCAVTDCDGNRDLITDGYNGFVIKNNSIADFTEKVLELWNNSDLLENLSKNAYKTFSERYNIDNNISKLESIYTECSKK